VVPFRSRTDLSRFFANGPGRTDALVLTAERGSAWSLLYPRFSVIVPQPQIMTIPLAYAVRSDDQQMVWFLNRWLELKKRDGTIERLYDYWVLGKNAEPTGPRWSIGRDVLHWWR
jgi:ABC-type amino acid transport substrate-binding protein